MIKKIQAILLNYRKRYNNEISYIELKRLLQNDKVYLIDVRSKQEYNEGHLPNAINIPVYEIENNIEQFVDDKESIVILYCQVGNRSKKALLKLMNKGYTNVYNLKGGLESI